MGVSIVDGFKAAVLVIVDHVKLDGLVGAGRFALGVFLLVFTQGRAAGRFDCFAVRAHFKANVVSVPVSCNAMGVYRALAILAVPKVAVLDFLDIYHAFFPSRVTLCLADISFEAKDFDFLFAADILDKGDKASRGRGVSFNLGGGRGFGVGIANKGGGNGFRTGHWVAPRVSG